MKKIIGLVVIALLAMAPASATHSEGIEVTGNIKISAPLSWHLFAASLTEFHNPCGTPSPDLGDLQGVDGYWIQLPIDEEGNSLLAGHTATLTSTTATAVDLDVWWYDAGCGFVGGTVSPHSHDMATHPYGGMIPEDPVGIPLYPYPGSEQNTTPNEDGIVPDVAAWAVVDLVTGANVDFTFSIPVQ